VVNGWAEAVRLRKVGQLYHRACAWVVARDGDAMRRGQDDGMEDDGLDTTGTAVLAGVPAGETLW
jgi:hypothetical protein